MASRLISVGDRLVLRRVDEETASGIIVPQTAHSREREDASQVYEVVNCDAVQTQDRGFTTGMRVLIGPFSGNVAKVGNDEFVIVAVSDVIAIVADA